MPGIYRLPVGRGRVTPACRVPRDGIGAVLSAGREDPAAEELPEPRGRSSRRHAHAPPGIRCPELCRDIVSPGLVYDVLEDAELAVVEMTLTAPGCSASGSLSKMARVPW